MESFGLNCFINQYPGVSPLIDYNDKLNQISSPFYIEDSEDDEYNLDMKAKEEKSNQNIKKEGPEKPDNNDNNKIYSEEDSLSLSINNKISGIMQSNACIESISLDIKNIKEDNKDNQKTEKRTTTDNTTDKIKLEKIFSVKKNKQIEMLPRIDYAIKNFKVTLVKYIKELANNLIKECKFKNELKKIKLFSPSNKYFTGISNEKENNIFLNFTVGQIFSYPNDEFGKDNRLQRNNKKSIEKIKAYIDNMKQKPKEYQKLVNFLDMTFEDAIIFFYKSDKFQEYKNDKKSKFLDNQFIKVKGFSIFETNSFIKMLKHTI